MIDEVLGGLKSSPDSDGTRLLIFSSNCAVSVNTSSSFVLSFRLYDRLSIFFKDIRIRCCRVLTDGTYMYMYIKYDEINIVVVIVSLARNI